MSPIISTGSIEGRMKTSLESIPTTVEANTNPASDSTRSSGRVYYANRLRHSVFLSSETSRWAKTPSRVRQVEPRIDDLDIPQSKSSGLSNRALRPPEPFALRATYFLLLDSNSNWHCSRNFQLQLGVEGCRHIDAGVALSARV
ncbi:hypothetical protein J6590_000179 [Homalodisca vitripennis]|nr:hypothetical protein J6590_000179 [Homalodisca vitripennis]